MMEKINWYKEVLEIEPNSKVFFPLAKLLVKDRLNAEAIGTLEKGLERHPEFLEARLLLIELLHRSGETEACDMQIAKLNQIFTSYAGFWEAWAACLSSKPADADTATIVRLLAATFITGPIHFHEVLDRGVSALLSEKRSREEAENTDANSSTASQQDSIKPELQFTTEQDNAPSDQAPVKAHEAEEDLPAVEEQELALADNNMQTIQETGLEQGQAEENLVNIEQTSTSSNYTDSYIESTSERPEDLSLNPEQQTEEADNMTDIENAESVSTEPVAQQIDSAELAPADEIPVSMAAEDSPEEFFSLRTRSMADVLASQGDLPGAIDIYSELAASTSDPLEKEELNKKIQELKGEERQETATSEADDAIEAIPPDKDSLLGILEALARRVQARVDS